MSDTDSEKSAPHTEEEEEKEARKDDGSIDFRSKRSTSVPHIIISDNLSTASSEGSSSNLKMRRRYSSASCVGGRVDPYDIVNSPRWRDSVGRKSISAKALKTLGCTGEQLMRAKALAKLGLTEKDLSEAAPYFESHEQCERTSRRFSNRFSQKLTKVLGATEEQILQGKAIKTLGVTVEDIDTERAQRLSAIGHIQGERPTSALCVPSPPVRTSITQIFNANSRR